MDTEPSRAGPGELDLSDPDVRRAVDCWCHGVAHLIAALGRERALEFMGTVVLEIAERADEFAVPVSHPGPQR